MASLGLNQCRPFSRASSRAIPGLPAAHANAVPHTSVCRNCVAALGWHRRCAAWSQQRFQATNHVMQAAGSIAQHRTGGTMMAIAFLHGGFQGATELRAACMAARKLSKGACRRQRAAQLTRSTELQLQRKAHSQSHVSVQHTARMQASCSAILCSQRSCCTCSRRCGSAARRHESCGRLAHPHEPRLQQVVPRRHTAVPAR